MNKIEDEKINRKNENLIPYKGQKYNPINMKIYDTEILNKDSQENTKLQNKFKLRKDLEMFYNYQEENNLRNSKK